MIEYRNQTFRKLYDRGDALVLENMHFEKCMFESCAISLTKDVHLRSTVRNVSVKNCAANGCGVGPAIFENVEVDGLATNDLLIVWEKWGQTPYCKPALRHGRRECGFPGDSRLRAKTWQVPSQRSLRLRRRTTEAAPTSATTIPAKVHGLSDLRGAERCHRAYLLLVLQMVRGSTEKASAGSPFRWRSMMT